MGQEKVNQNYTIYNSELFRFKLKTRIRKDRENLEK